MAVPHVSPENYGRVRTFAQIELGGESPRVEDLSFNSQLVVIISNTGGADEPLSVLDEMLKMDNPIHPGWVTEVELTVPRDSSSGRQGSVGEAGRRRAEKKRERQKEILKDSSLSAQKIIEGVFADHEREVEEEPEEEDEINIERVNEAFQGRVKEMPTFRVAVADRSRPHRPEVSAETERALRAAVQELRPRVPAGAFDFDGVLSVFLEELEERYEEMAIEIEVVEWVR